MVWSAFKVFTAKHKFLKIWIVLLFSSTKFGKWLFHHSPSALNHLGIVSSHRIDKFIGMVDCPMNVVFFLECTVWLPTIIIFVPGRLYCLINGINVSVVRSSTGLKKNNYLYPQNTHTPSTLLPLWCFRFPNFDSSTSTTSPWPPIGDNLSLKYFHIPHDKS